MLFGRSDGLQLPTLQQSVDPALQDGERKNLCCSKKKKTEENEANTPI